MMETDPFAAYALPLGLTEGVQIALPGTPAVFTVVLPAQANEDFSMILMTMMTELHGAEGLENIRTDPTGFQKMRRKAFFKACIKSAEGIPGDIDQFFESYPLAAQHVFSEASVLALRADEEIADALGKSKPTRSGKHSGVGKQNSTNKSSKAALM